MIEQLRRLWLPLTIAGIVAAALAKMGAPSTSDEAMVFTTIGAFGLLALLVQRMDARQDTLMGLLMKHHEQEMAAWTRVLEISQTAVVHQGRTAEILNAGMGEIGNHMATTNAELRTLSERNLAALNIMQRKLLQVGLRRPAPVQRRRRKAR